MKLKSIMHALSYGKSRKSLVRSEGARRVRQAEKKLSELRKLQKVWSYCERYGSSSQLQQCHSYEVFKQRSDSPVGIKFLEEDLGTLEEKMKIYAKARGAGKTW